MCASEIWKGGFVFFVDFSSKNQLKWETEIKRPKTKQKKTESENCSLISKGQIGSVFFIYIRFYIMASRIKNRLKDKTKKYKSTTRTSLKPSKPREFIRGGVLFQKKNIKFGEEKIRKHSSADKRTTTTITKWPNSNVAWHMNYQRQ